MSPQDAIHKLLAAGWSQKRIADEVSASQPTIYRIKAGTQKVSFDLGAALIALAERERTPGEEAA